MKTNKNTIASLSSQLILETFRLNGEMLDAGNKLTKPHGLTSARWQVMGAIAQSAEQPLTVAQIARRMGLTRQGVRRIVKDLEQTNMLVLVDNLDHQRAKWVQLTAEGISALKAVQEVHVRWITQLSRGLDEEQIAQACEIMKTIRERSEKLSF